MPPSVEERIQRILEDYPHLNEEVIREILTGYEEEDPGLRQLAEFRNPSQITRVEEGENVVRYKDVMLLSPGIWTDAGSRQTIHYSGEGIRASAENWIDGAAWRESREKVPAESGEVNFLHGPALFGAESLDDIGRVPTESIVVDDENRLYGDIVLDGSSAQGETAIDLMDEVLEAAQDPSRTAPPVGPSVEIADDVVTETEGGVLEMEEAWFTGIGIVFNPASKPVEMESQVRDRAVAMADDLGVEEGGLLLRESEESGEGSDGTLNSTSRQEGGMGENERKEVLAGLRTMAEAVEEMTRVLQVDEEMAQVLDAVQQFQEAGGGADAPVTEFIAWASENTDLDEETLNAAVSEYVEAIGADSPEETPVEQFLSWLREQGAPEEEEETEGTGEGEGEGELSASDLDDAMATISEFNSRLDDISEMLTSATDDLEENLEDMERRLSTIEDEELQQGRTLQNGDEFYEGDVVGGGDEGEHEDVMI